VAFLCSVLLACSLEPCAVTVVISTEHRDHPD